MIICLALITTDSVRYNYCRTFHRSVIFPSSQPHHTSTSCCYYIYRNIQQHKHNDESTIIMFEELIKLHFVPSLTKALNQSLRSGNSGYYINYHMNCNWQHLIAIKAGAVLINVLLQLLLICRCFWTVCTSSTFYLI
jgi:hypothetical protein